MTTTTGLTPSLIESNQARITAAQGDYDQLCKLRNAFHDLAGTHLILSTDPYSVAVARDYSILAGKATDAIHDLLRSEDAWKMFAAHPDRWSAS